MASNPYHKPRIDLSPPIRTKKKKVLTQEQRQQITQELRSLGLLPHQIENHIARQATWPAEEEIRRCSVIMHPRQIRNRNAYALAALRNEEITKRCPHCHKSFVPITRVQRYCRMKCRLAKARERQRAIVST